MEPNNLQWIIQRGRLRLTATPTLYRCEPIWSWTVGSLPDYAMLLTLEGRGQIMVDGRQHPLRQGVCLFLKPTQSVEAEQNPSYPLYLFIARFEVLDATGQSVAPQRLDGPTGSIFIRNTKHLETLADLVASRSNGKVRNDPLAADAINMLLRLLVEETTRHSGQFDARAYEALRAIENDLARKWTVAELAREAGVSASTFSKAFNAMMREPPIHYVVRRRMEEAKRQIQQSSLPIDEIAINLGYSDMTFFRSLFRRRLGQTPESIRSGRAF